MGIFWKSKNKNELVLVFNIESSSVGGALLRVQDSGIPNIIFSTKEPILVEKKMDLERFLFLTIQSLEAVAKQIYKTGLGAPARIFCVLSSPWYTSQTRIISFKKDTPFVFNTKLADELIQKEIKAFEEEQSAKYRTTENSVRAIELKNIKTTLNGYETPKPLNQKAKELTMAIFVSVSGEEVLKKIENTIAKHFYFRQIRFSSFAMASFAVVRDIHIQQENFLLINIGGEVTDISMAKENTLQESISFPLGHNFFVRGVASGLDCTLGEASSLISLIKDEHADKSTSKKLQLVIDQLKTEWLKKFQESLANLSNDISIPATIYMATEKDFAGFFSGIIKTEQFSQYTLAESEFKVIFLGPQEFQGMAVLEENTVRDSFLIIDAIYINRFLIKI